LARSLGAVFNGQYNGFVIHSHLFSLENIDKIEKTRKILKIRRNQLLKSGDLAILNMTQQLI